MPRSRPSRSNPEALEALRERLRATQEAAQRLAEEATSSVPPRGWDVPGRAEEAGEELEALVNIIRMLRDVVPPELRAQLAELVRQLLVFVRAVLDWWIDQIESGPPGDDRRVEDIPIT